jgi:predicted RNA binding protein YcfA (HicA-like mRNA interferase family)
LLLDNISKGLRMDKRLKKLIKYYVSLGWYLDRKGKHLIYKHPKGGTVTISGSTSDVNTYWSVRRHFKKEMRLNLIDTKDGNENRNRV